MSPPHHGLKKNYRCVPALQQFYTGGPFSPSPSAAFLACACGDEIKLIDAASAALIATLEGDSESVTALAFGPDDRLLFSASHSRLIRVWDLDSFKCIRSWKGHDGPVMGMACHGSGGLLATAGADKRVCVWDVDGGFCTHFFRGHQGIVTSIMFHSIPKRLLLSYFQAVTGLSDPDLCAEILAAHDWDLELAISSITSNPAVPAATSPPSDSGPSDPGPSNPSPADPPLPAPPGLAWKLITLPFYVVSGSFSLVAGAVGIGAWIAGGVLSRSLGLLGFTSPAPAATEDRLIPLSASAAEAAAFIAVFERDFCSAASVRPNFAELGFMEALQRAQREFRLLFVYLHSPEHPDTPEFCSGCLCSEAVADFVNENFVCWGGSIRGSEGFKMSNSLKASRFPFCAIVAAASNQQIMLIQQIEGPISPDRMLMILNQVIEESTPSLVTARLEAEERANNTRLREEQDAAYRAALEADQARERQRKEEQERLERETAEAERKRMEEEEAQERAVREAAEREAALARRRQEKAMSLGTEPEKGPDVTQVLVRFPNGERKGRRFESSATVRSIYDYVDSLDCLTAEKYNLVSNFPRVSYGADKHSLTLKEAGLHPQASLFIEME